VPEIVYLLRLHHQPNGMGQPSEVEVVEQVFASKRLARQWIRDKGLRGRATPEIIPVPLLRNRSDFDG